MDFSMQVGARTLWQEARGEPHAGQRAVAHVLANRLKSGRWGGTLGEVCLYPFAFSGWNPRDPNRLAAARLPDDDPSLVALAALLDAALAKRDEDPTGGALSYYAPKALVTPPAWAARMRACGAFGSQLFFK